MEAPRAFDGIKVADFSWGLSGPLVAKYLGDHGAEVVHIESSIFPDLVRTTAPYKEGISGMNRSLYWANCNASKYGITLNLRHPLGLGVAKRIVAWADIIIESFVPGTLKKLRLEQVVHHHH